MNELPGGPLTVGGWIGSKNAGDELVHAGLRKLLAERGVDVCAITVDPAGTAARHGGATVSRTRAAAGMWAGRAQGSLVLGGGGLLQDETSVWNLPYHLAPVAAARRRGLHVAGIGLGAGPITSAIGRRMVGAALSGIDLTVRDDSSADVLAGLGLPRPQVGADLALELPDPQLGAVEDVLAVALRPWSGRRHVLPVSWSRRSLEPEHVARLVQLVDAVAARLGLGVRFVAFDTEKDDPLHRAVAERLKAEVTEVLAPDPFGALAAVAGSRAVVAMRYHAGIAALLGRRPAVLLGYSPKVNSLAADVGAGFGSVPWSVADPAAVGAAATRAVGQAGEGVLDAALARLRTRGRANSLALDRLLGL